MPSRNSKGNSRSDDSFQNSLDQLEEILNIYSDSHAVYLLGDFNASMVQRKGNGQDRMLEEFVSRYSLEYQQNGQNTFTHPNTSDQAEIDYIFYNQGPVVQSSVSLTSSLRGQLVKCFRIL